LRTQTAKGTAEPELSSGTPVAKEKHPPAYAGGSPVRVRARRRTGNLASAVVFAL
jgi:hypothetical protein